MTINQKKLIMIGLPATGKTTFLAALWYVVNNLDEVPTALGLKELQGDDTYLNRIVDNWVKYQKVDRTIISSEKLVSMELVDNSSKKPIQVFFPDVSGERFRQQVEDRQCKEDYFLEVQQAFGALLFIHSGNIVRPNRIDEAEALEQIIGKQSDNEESSSNKLSPWKQSIMPTQVKLVELLQFILDIPNIRKPFNLVIILSAWDLVCEHTNSQKEFFEKRLPLLDQFLKTNHEVLTTKIYGISAQGVSFEDEAVCHNLAEKSLAPSERIIVKSEDVEPHDITAPVKWLMGIED